MLLQPKLLCELCWGSIQFSPDPPSWIQTPLRGRELMRKAGKERREKMKTGRERKAGG